MAIADEADCGEVADVDQHEPVKVAKAEGANEVRAACQRRKFHDPAQRPWVDLYRVEGRREEEERRQDDEEEEDEDEESEEKITGALESFQAFINKKK